MAYKKEEIDKLFSETILRISKGESVRGVLMDEHMPSTQTFYVWLGDSVKSKQYAIATEIRADHIFDEMMEIADTPVIGHTEKEKEGVIETTTSDMLGHRRLQVDVRKWYLSKLNPKKYGDKIQSEVVNTNLNVEMTKEEAKSISDKIKGDC